MAKYHAVSSGLKCLCKVDLLSPVLSDCGLACYDCCNCMHACYHCKMLLNCLPEFNSCGMPMQAPFCVCYVLHPRESALRFAPASGAQVRRSGQVQADSLQKLVSDACCRFWAAKDVFLILFGTVGAVCGSAQAISDIVKALRQ